MAVELSFESATELHAIALAPDLRPEDLAEVLACGRHGALDALVYSVQLSTACWAAVADGEVAAMFGLCPGDEVWFLTGHGFRRHRRAFIRAAPFVLAELLARSGRLGNWIDARYSAAVRWAKWLGFEVAPAVPYGPTGALFHPARYIVRT